VDARDHKATILLLPDTVINQIAAGEVVERPASVVKELVENSIDAGADRIEVSIERGGMGNIRISDNGRGIPTDQIRIALERHATSKIDAVEDLETISTFGFRGEALPSVASVSRLRISSRTIQEETASWVELEGGRETGQGEEVLENGTSIAVRDLFFNIPARLKFQKSEPTETAHIHDTVLRFALANPRIHFTFHNEARTVLDFPPDSSLMERVRAVLRRRGKGSVRAQLVHGTTEPGSPVSAEIIVAPPEVSLRDSSGCYFFVNGRFVKDRLLLRALTGGYGTLLDKGRFPVAVVFLTLDPREVDVNVHPQKTEVRFLHERAVVAAIRSCVTRTLASAPWTPLKAISTSVDATQAPRGPKPVKYQLLTEQQSGEEAGDYETTRRRILERVAASPLTKTGREPSGSTGPAVSERRMPPMLPLSRPPRPPVEAAPAPPVPAQTTGEPADGAVYLGCHGGLYLLFSVGDQLLVLDMHAAHERVRYASILKEMDENVVRSQLLLFPETVPLSPQQMEIALANLTLLRRAGLDAEPFGPGTLVVRTVPAILTSPNVKALMEDVLEEIETGGSGEDLGGLTGSIAATMACHSAYRKGDTISPSAARLLLQKVEALESGGHCPHGRPVSFSLSPKELETRFKRR